MKFLVILCILSVGYGLIMDSEWESFKVKYERSYQNENDDLHRRMIFEANKLKIEEHNMKYEQGVTTYELEMNQFGDMTDEEFAELMLTVNETLMSGEHELITFIPPASTDEIPESVDWRKEGAVTPVKNQGYCGSCWAFSAVGTLESLNFRKTGKLERLSEQNLLDCSWKYGNHGCNGGMPEFALRYVHENGGINSEASYPYQMKTMPCFFDKTKIAAKITGVAATKKGNEDELRAAIATIGPISVCIDAKSSFKFYKRGVYKDPLCSRRSINHAVLAVGYGTENGHDYWLVKNSWGVGWGDKGYIKMARNQKNHCAIASFARFPLFS